MGNVKSYYVISLVGYVCLFAPFYWINNVWFKSALLAIPPISFVSLLSLGLFLLVHEKKELLQGVVIGSWLIKLVIVSGFTYMLMNSGLVINWTMYMLSMMSLWFAFLIPYLIFVSYKLKNLTK